MDLDTMPLVRLSPDAQALIARITLDVNRHLDLYGTQRTDTRDEAQSWMHALTNLLTWGMGPITVYPDGPLDSTNSFYCAGGYNFAIIARPYTNVHDGLVTHRWTVHS